MVQSLFDLFVEKTWAVPTVSARMIRNQDGSILAMPVTLASDNDVKQVRPGGGWLAPMVLDVHKPWDVPLRSALVADRNSIWAFIVAYAAVKVMFRSKLKLCTGHYVLEKLTPSPRAGQRRFQRHQGGNPYAQTFTGSPSQVLQ
jgi:hypothetical protein